MSLREGVCIILATATLLATGAALVRGGSAESSASPEVKLVVVKRKQLRAELRKLRGHVVVLDVWADFCLPCKREFPHLVELHKKYAGAGLVCVSVSVDEAARQGAALKFLRSRGATFPNYLLDEEPAGWQAEFDIYGPPAVLVYGRDGNVAGRFDNNDVNKSFTYQDVEKLVRKALPRPGKRLP
jgi:thiol-disulfide isomerase/thioredoxin